MKMEKIKNENEIENEKVRFVVDSGYVKQSAYDPVRHMDSLVVVPISQVTDYNKI